MMRFIEEARSDYEGLPIQITTEYDHYGEVHIIIEMKYGNETYYLDWIGGEYADVPDELEFMPFSDPDWIEIKPAMEDCQ